MTKSRNNVSRPFIDRDTTFFCTFLLFLLMVLNAKDVTMTALKLYVFQCILCPLQSKQQQLLIEIVKQMDHGRLQNMKVSEKKGPKMLFFDAYLPFPHFVNKSIGNHHLFTFPSYSTSLKPYLHTNLKFPLSFTYVFR